MRHRIQQRNVVALSAFAEMGAAIFLTAFPGLVIELLLGSRPAPAAVPIARFAGLLMLGLGVAGWPARPPVPSVSAFRGLLLYNALFAAYFAYLGVIRHLGGPLLWPAVVFHSALVLVLLATTRGAPGATTSP